MNKYRKFLAYVIFSVISLCVIELFFYSYYKFFISKDLKERVYYIIGERNNRSFDVSWCTPYLWSNYTFNPLSLRGSEYGWRYGRGEKKKKYRIICLGGSTTFSDPVKTGDLSYPAILEKIMLKEGYDVDIVNCGLPYYSSAEVLGNYLFKGTYLDADVILIMTGLNDIEPLMSPKDYKPDYSHWRVYGGIDRDKLFLKIWNALPSWTVRTITTVLLKPGQGVQNGYQLTNVQESINASTSIEERYPLGLEQNLIHLVATISADSALPVLITDNFDPGRKGSLFLLGNDTKGIKTNCSRAKLAFNKNMAILDSIANQLEVPLIDFSSFKPTNDKYWIDHCHLDENGTVEQANFIYNKLIQIPSFKQKFNRVKA